MTIESKVKSVIADTINNLFNTSVAVDNILIQKTKKEFKGDYTLVVFPYVKFSGLNPEQTAKKIGENLINQQNIFTGYNVVKGFLNMELNDTLWIEHFRNNAHNEKYGYQNSSNTTIPVLVEYSSPNTNKPLHLGHIRNILLGYSIAKILEANGRKVVKVNIVNDRGIHICKSMLAYQLYGNGETPESSQIKGDHLVGKYYVIFDQAYKKEIAELIQAGKTKEEAEKQAPLMLKVQEMLRNWEAGDKETLALWETMNRWVYKGFDTTYKALGVDFDKIYYESDTYLLGKKEVENGLAKEIFYKKPDNSVWIDLTKDGLDEKVIQRADGTSLYITQDIGTSIKRHEEYGFDKMIYVVGNEQDYHFKVLFKILEKFGFDWAKGLFHCSYGMVELPEGKMKSREGTVIDADDLISEMIDISRQTTEELGKTEGFNEAEKEKLYQTVGLGALKYFILKVDPKKKMLFNPAESIDFHGNTGPFIQYTYARIKSILRKVDFDYSLPASIQINSKERELLKLIYEFEQTIIDAGTNYSPALIANYVYELAKEFNQYYHDYPILKEENEGVKKFRVNLVSFVSNIIKTSMKLLGVDVPEQM
ncbi:MAG: arginine--tRNA ligase [Bacteroidia bacterium]|nr:arginine--tRNA ligase [Bacteroidia bacterium]MCZ2249709.1 arginine--tRNA ligase [Bacteroidia bacterium]